MRSMSRAVIGVVASLVLIGTGDARGDVTYCKAIKRIAHDNGIRLEKSIGGMSAIESLVAQLNDPDNGIIADLAYCKLVRKKRALPFLLTAAGDLTGQTTAYPGNAYANPLASTDVGQISGSSAGPTQAMISLYEFEAIISRSPVRELKYSPGTLPELTSLGSYDQLTLLQSALVAYQSWLAAHPSTSSVKKAGSHPLDGTDISWR